MQFYHLIHQIWVSSWHLFFLYVCISLPAYSSPNIPYSSSTAYVFPWYIIFLLLRTSSLLLLLLLCSFCLPSKCPWCKLLKFANCWKTFCCICIENSQKNKEVIISDKIPSTFWRSCQNIDRQPKRQNPWLLW